MPLSPRDKPRLITPELLRRWPLLQPDGGSKEQRGRALVIAGAVEMPGAAILASTAALRAGAGKVRVAIAEAAALYVGSAVPELFVLSIGAGKRRHSSLASIIDSAQKADAILIGPGMRDVRLIRAILPRLFRLKNLRAVIVDATALPIAAEFLCGVGSSNRDRHPCPILTPHAAEMASICKIPVAEVEDDPLSAAGRIAKRFASIVVLKGAETFVCSPDGRGYVNKRGNVGLGTAGSGDVLAGLMTGLCARGVDPVGAAAWAVSIHARAGERLARAIGHVGYLAREIADQIPRLLPG